MSLTYEHSRCLSFWNERVEIPGGGLCWTPPSSEPAEHNKLTPFDTSSFNLQELKQAEMNSRYSVTLGDNRRYTNTNITQGRYPLYIRAARKRSSALQQKTGHSRFTLSLLKQAPGTVLTTNYRPTLHQHFSSCTLWSVRSLVHSLPAA